MEGWTNLIRIPKEKAKRIKNRKTVEETFDNLMPNYKTRIVRNILKKIQVFPDEPVTGDIHRLIRLPGSLHGKTGLMVKILSKEELEVFNPYEMPIAFDKKPVKVRNVVGRPVTMGNDYKLDREEIKELPEFVAIYFMAMKFATLCLES